jgi:hypothetical protein
MIIFRLNPLTPPAHVTPPEVGLRREDGGTSPRFSFAVSSSVFVRLRRNLRMINDAEVWLRVKNLRDWRPDRGRWLRKIDMIALIRHKRNETESGWGRCSMCDDFNEISNSIKWFRGEDLIDKKSRPDYDFNSGVCLSIDSITKPVNSQSTLIHSNRDA